MMTVGEVLDALYEADPELPVYYDFCSCVPTTVESWRGIYAQPALGWEPHGRQGVTVGYLIAELEKCIDGRTYIGYKGGDYIYDRESQLHIDNYGKCTSTELTGVELAGWCVFLKTTQED